MLDYQMCPGRLTNGAGLLNSVVNGSGNYVLSFSNTPKIDPEVYTAATNTAFGNLFVLGSDNRMRQLQAPETANLTMQTNGTGDLVLAPTPTATIPDPLEVTDLVVTGDATLENLEVNGDVELNGISTGTAVNLLAVDATNQVILQAIGQGLSISMFFESATSPGAGSPPNEAKNSNDYLVIGNRLFDSGQDNIAVTTSESLTVQDAGNYLIMWQAQCRMGGGTGRNAGVWLELNGTIVNYGNGRTTSVGGISASNGAMFQLTGMDVRTYAAGTVIKLILNATDTDIATYEARLVAVRIP